MRLLPVLVVSALTAFAAGAQEEAPPADPASSGPEPLVLPVSAVPLSLPAEAGSWTADSLRDDSGAADLLVRDAPGMPELRVALALAPAGQSCDGMLARLGKRSGMSLFDRPAWASARWHAQATDETDFEAGAQIQAICAPLGQGALAAVVSHGGDAAELGGADGALGRLLDAVVDAFDAAGGSAAAFAPTGAPLPTTTSLVARLRFMADPASATAALAARSGSFTLPSGSGVLVTIEEKVTSKKAEKGQKIKASIAQDVVLDDAVLIKKGTPVVAHVGEVDAASLGGSGGSIRIEVDSTTAVDGQTVPLHYESQAKEGEDTRGISVTGMFTGWGLLSKGKNVEIQAGTTVEARSTAAVSIKAGG
ncbi:MAG: hypothetical protein KF822_04870 [Steroidobacteraceae bacterium]|nr:hypothetical protein [Steroidobacteraceae bacterium]